MPNRVDLVFTLSVRLVRDRWSCGGVFFQRDRENFIDIFHRNEFQTLFCFFWNIDQVFFV